MTSKRHTHSPDRLARWHWHTFLLVPVGRGEGLRGEELDAKMYEDVLEWLYTVEKKNEIEMKVTCAPHYYRIVKEKGTHRRAQAASREKALCLSLTEARPNPAVDLKWPQEMSRRQVYGRSGRNHLLRTCSVIFRRTRVNAWIASS